MEFLMKPIPAEDSEYIEYKVAGHRMFTGSGFEFDEEDGLKKQVDIRARSNDLTGGLRHTLSFAAIDQSAEFRPHRENLSKLTLPVTVIHGSDDSLIPLVSGRETADLIPGANLVVIEGMGHELPSGAWPQIVQAIVETVDKAQPHR